MQVGPRRHLVHPASRPILDMPHSRMRCVILSRNASRPSAYYRLMGRFGQSQKTPAGSRASLAGIDVARPLRSARLLARAAIAVSLLASLVVAPAIAVTRVVCSDDSAACPPSMEHVQAGSMPALDCCEACMEAPLAPALSERTASLIAIPAGVPLTVSPSALETGAIGGTPSLPARAAGPPLFLKVRALLI